MRKPNIRNATLVAALAAVIGTAWATHEPASSETPAAAPSERVVWTELERSAAATHEVAPGDSLDPKEAVVEENAPAIERPAPAAPRNAPLVERSVAEPPVVIEEKRLTVDERIQADVMDRIAALPNISGKIGVVSQDSVVTLTGYTSTAGQAYRAGREARNVFGVKAVQNEIRPRIGGTV